MTFASVDDYVASFPSEVQSVLREARARIHARLPDPGDRISYNIACMTSGGRDVVYVAGWKKHIALYPVPDGGPADDEFRARIAPYRSGASTAKFMLNQPVPWDLVEQMADLHLAAMQR